MRLTAACCHAGGGKLVVDRLRSAELVSPSVSHPPRPARHVVLADGRAAAVVQVMGTKGGFFGETVELKSKYEQLGYIKGDGTSDSKAGSIIGAGVALVGVLATLVALSGM
jgi:hypothetical protein